jgi:valyl-tRNA synthetase
MKTMQDLIVTVRALRKDLGVPEKEAAPILLHADNRILALADANQDMLARMARVQSVEFASGPLSGSNARSTPDFDVAVTYERQIDVEAERERLKKELARLAKILASSEKQLNNEAFMAKAPAHIVEGLRKQYAETKTLYDKIKAALDDLPPE